MNRFLALLCVVCTNLIVTAYAKPIVSNLVDPAKYYLNHEKQITDLSSRLALYNVAGLVGLSGIGKTELARKYAYQSQDKYNLIWFFNCATDLSEQFVNLSKHINESNLCAPNKCNLSEDIKKAKRDVLNFLAPKNNWLLVFDNLHVNQNGKILDIINWAHNGHVMLCSQDAKYLPNAIHLPYLSDNDSTNVFNTILDEQNPQVVGELVKAFKGYPLLIVQGAMFLNKNKHMTVEEYKRILSKSEDKLYSHVELVLTQLPETTKHLLYKIAVINNQSFSKKLIQDLTNNDNFSEDLNNLTRFGIINITDNNKDNQIFEMHDAIKDAILKIIGNKEAKNTVISVISCLNNLLPNYVSIALSQDKTLKGNLEVLLFNAEKYEVDIYKNMELRKNLFSAYMNSLDYYNSQKMEEWLMIKQSKFDSFLGSMLMSNRQKAIYSEYMVQVAVYKYFSSAFPIGLMYLTKAQNIMKTVKDYPEIKFFIFSELAQIYVFGADVQNAENYLEKADEIARINPKAQLDIGLLWFLRAKLYLSKSEYQKALDAIDQLIKIDVAAGLPQDTTFTAPTYILQAEILNYMGRFQEAYDLMKKIEAQEAKNIKGGQHEVHARIFTQLARSELGLGMKEEALKHAEKAMSIHDYNDHLINDNEYASSYDAAVAMTSVALGHALAATDSNHDAIIDAYEKARKIYYNRYRENSFLTDDIKQFYLKAAENLCKIANSSEIVEKIVYTEFRDKLVEHWANDPKTNQILELEKKYNCRILPTD